MSTLLEGRGLCAWRGDNLLFDQLDLTLSAGQVLQLIGVNGSGKSTLLRALIGLAELDDGELTWRGVSLAREWNAFHEELLYIGHKPGISGALNALENLRALVGEEADDSAIVAALGEVGLAERIELPCRALSAGQQRRVALARLRLQQRRVLWLLDEPLTALDATGLAWVRQRIVEHASSGGAVVYTTHQPMALSEVPVFVLSLNDERPA